MNTCENKEAGNNTRFYSTSVFLAQRTNGGEFQRFNPIIWSSWKNYLTTLHLGVAVSHTVSKIPQCWAQQTKHSVRIYNKKNTQKLVSGSGSVQMFMVPDLNVNSLMFLCRFSNSMCFGYRYSTLLTFGLVRWVFIRCPSLLKLGMAGKINF